MIAVGRPYLPDRRNLDRYLDRIYESRWLTNSGPLVNELEGRLSEYLGVDNLLLVANGTLALQVAYRALGVSGSAVTSPFTFVATASSLKWQGVEPLFGDIDPGTLNLQPETAERAIQPDTSAAVPVHVYGTPCDVEAFADLSRRRGLRLIYDASHGFGVDRDGTSLLNWGDAATLSFHATKVFHTVEGGAIRFARKEDRELARKLINFGMEPGRSDIREVGCNAKMSEMHAAMGLAILDDIDRILDRRVSLQRLYMHELGGYVGFPQGTERATRNGAYAPILLPDSATRDEVQSVLSSQAIYAKPYFYPSLTETSAYAGEARQETPKAFEAAGRVLCLPLSDALTDSQVRGVCETIRKVLD